MAVISFAGVANLHWIVSINFPFVREYLLVLFFCGCGFICFHWHIPECLFPGKFDYFANSHQLWHVFLVIGLSLQYDLFHKIELFHDVYNCGISK